MKFALYSRQREMLQNYDRITVMAPKGKKEEWGKIAKEKGFKGLSGYIIDCVEKAGEN